MLSIFLLIPLSLMLFVVAIWAVRYAVKSNQFEDLDNASQLIILEDRQERRQTIQAHETKTSQVTADNTENNSTDKPVINTVDNNDANIKSSSDNDKPNS